MTSRAARRSLVGLMAAIVLLGACGRGDQRTGETGTGARTYRVRGILESVPSVASGPGQLRIRHEAILDFVGPGGEIEGMAAMTMPFPVASGVDLSGLHSGDLVRFDLRVDWEAAQPVAVTAIEKLPAGTELALE